MTRHKETNSYYYKPLSLLSSPSNSKSNSNCWIVIFASLFFFLGKLCNVDTRLRQNIESASFSFGSIISWRKQLIHRFASILFTFSTRVISWCFLFHGCARAGWRGWSRTVGSTKLLCSTRSAKRAGWWWWKWTITKSSRSFIDILWVGRSLNY